MTKTAIESDILKTNQLTDKEKDTLLLAKGGGVAFVGNLSATAIQFFFGLVMARLLGAELLGLYSLSSTVVDLLVVLSMLGLSASIVRYIPIAFSRKEDATVWGVIQVGVALPTLISLILGTGLFLLAEPIALGFFNQPELVPILRLASMGIPFYTIMTALSSVTKAFKRMEYIVYAHDLTFNILRLALSVILLLIGLGVIGVVLANNAALVVAAGMFLYFVNHLFNLNRPVSQAKRNVREMLNFSLPVYLTRVLSRVSGSIESLILGALGLISGVGIYSTALRLSSVGSMFHQSLQSIAMPMISDLHSRGESSQLTSVYRTTAKWGMTFNLPIFLMVAIYAEEILSIFGTEFIIGATILPIIAFATLFNASTGVCGSIITMTGHSRLTFVNSIINLGLNIVLDVLFIPRMGIVGAAIAVTLTSVSINILRVIQVKVLLNILPYEWTFLKPLTAALIGTGVTILAQPLLQFLPVLVQLAVAGLILCGVYIVVIYLLKLSEEDRLVLNRLSARFRISRS